MTARVALVVLADRLRGSLLGAALAFAPPLHAESTAAPPADADDLSWLMSAPWGKAAMILIAAVAVLLLGNAMATRRRTKVGGRAARLDFDVTVARLEAQPAVAIAAAVAGPVHLRGRILSGSGSLGSRDGHERVWHNRAGAGRRTAIGAELIIVGDDSGQVGIENLESARVIAPRDAGRPHDTVSLYVGDRVEVLGIFVAERHGDDEDSTRNVYGLLGSASQVQLRLLARYDAAEAGPDAALDPPSPIDEAIP